MNINNLNSELRFINRIGQTLSTEEIIGLQSGVIKLSHEYNYEHFQFWGRLQGTKLNYYLVAGITFKGCTNFPTKKYFWSSQDFKFAELVSPRSQFVQQVKSMTSYFTGQHQKILIKGNGMKKTLQLDGQDFVVKTKNFTQLDRLAIIVQMIDKQCQVVPLGAYKMLPTHQLIKDPGFRGLKMNQITQLNKYVHLRAPELHQKKILIECDKALERSDFLDSLDQSDVKDSWTVHTDESKTESTVRSLIWPGYMGYHRANSNIFGNVYMGPGLRCEDFPFIS